MKRAAILTILVLLLCAMTAEGIPIPGIQGRCKCILTTTKRFDPNFIRNVKYIPRGPHCVTTEIIITMKNGMKVCMNPNTKWLKTFIKAIKATRLQK
ncbi:interleukin-8-like [Chiloscyllium plagiosum]|uniref:interleukin-8-like n=1 Tax=Chiloscyllium plagiosum TaxID=36176 RepID=UPI001CB7E954|nr:interleukin-8-like [Chiloscyllium plagiosum]